ncbi:hypothetical protein [Paraburkholderia caledonica]|uniref:hypothetical protein n=1 Tax=Paraburkholderia caledonica TaxID=134536 RepID=UPI000B400660|nr:hypothetical protein [Paraburkholderia caledonica]
MPHTSSPVPNADISSEFVQCLRESASAHQGYVAYVADASQVSGGKIKGNERYVAIVLSDTDASAVPNRAAPIHAEVRRTAEGFPIACVMFALRLAEVDARIVSQAFPSLYGRLNVLWIFRDIATIESHAYSAEMEEDFENAFCVADGHRDEYDPYDDHTQRTDVEVHTGFVLEGIGSLQQTPMQSAGV